MCRRQTRPCKTSVSRQTVDDLRISVTTGDRREGGWRCVVGKIDPMQGHPVAGRSPTGVTAARRAGPGMLAGAQTSLERQCYRRGSGLPLPIVRSPRKISYTGRWNVGQVGDVFVAPGLISVQLRVPSGVASMESSTATLPGYCHGPIDLVSRSTWCILYGGPAIVTLSSNMTGSIVLLSTRVVKAAVFSNTRCHLPTHVCTIFRLKHNDRVLASGVTTTVPCVLPACEQLPWPG